MAALLEAVDVRAGYDGREVVSGASLQVNRGELWAVLGPNGAGKSTFLKACLGLVPLRGGAVTLLGQPLGRWERRALARQVAWVPQSAELEAGFSALDVVLMGRAPHHRGLALPSGEDVDRAHAALEELGVGGLAGRPVLALSGGERRLILLARALVQTPELLLLDEPTAFLDLKHQVEVLARVRARVRAGLGAVAVLHDVNLAAAYADRVLLLREGKTLAQGEARSLLEPALLEELYALPMVGAAGPDGHRIFAPRTPP